MKPHFIVFPLLLAGLTACGGPAPEPLPSPSAAPASSSPAALTPSPSSSPAPVSSPSPSVEETFKFNPSGYSKDQQDAVATVKEFFHYYDKAFADPGQPIQRLSELIDGEYLEDLSVMLVEQEQAAIKTLGTARYVVAQVDPIQSIDGEKWVRVYTCQDTIDMWSVDTNSGEKFTEGDARYLVYRHDVRFRDVWQIPVGRSKWSDTCAP